MTVLELLEGARAELQESGWIGPAGEALPFSKHPKHITVAAAFIRARELEPDPEDATLLAAWDELERSATPRAWEENRFYASIRGREPTDEELRRAFALMLAPPAVDIRGWLEASDRKPADVLNAFNRSIYRLQGESNG